jgi:hypothetical protein
MKFSIRYVLISLWAILICSASSAESRDLFIPNEDTFSLGITFPQELSLGDVQFIQPINNSAISSIELYMLNGWKSSPIGPVDPWWKQVWQVVEDYYNTYNTIPEKLDLPTLSKLYGETESTLGREVWVQNLRSPLTGDFPILNSKNFIIGQLYVRQLTETEIQYYCNYNDIMYKNLITHIVGIEDSTRTATTNYTHGPVLYWRMYGRDSVIQTLVLYRVYATD